MFKAIPFTEIRITGWPATLWLLQKWVDESPDDETRAIHQKWLDDATAEADKAQAGVPAASPGM